MSMGKSLLNDFYVEGQNPILDKKFAAYKKMNIWAGYGLSAALRGDEVDTIIDLWKKENRCRWKLTVREVSVLVDASSRILSYRMNMKKEKARIRKEKSREKLRRTAKTGDLEARKKTNDIKKYDKKYSDRCRLKRKSSTAGSSGGLKARKKIAKRKKSKRKI